MKTDIIVHTLTIEHPTVQSVLQIAEEIMAKNQILNIENLYNIAKRRLKIPRKGLLSIIQFLINKKFLIEGSKYSRDTVLLNYLRKNIYRFIKTQGAVHFSFIRKRFNSDSEVTLTSSGQLIWHLEMLIKFKFIKKIKVGNYTVFLPTDMDEELGVIHFLLKDKLNKKIIILTYKQELIKRSEVYKILNEKRENVYYRIKNLIENDILSLKQEPNKEIFINTNKKELLDEILKKNQPYKKSNNITT